MWITFIALAGFISTADSLIGRTQSAGVRGYLMCGNQPASNVLVKLYDDDRGIDTDDLMASGRTDARGFFQIAGYTDEFTTIDPKLNIYHNCNDYLPCERKLTIYVPDEFVSMGRVPSRIFDIRQLNLAPRYKGETRDCLH